MGMPNTDPDVTPLTTNDDTLRAVVVVAAPRSLTRVLDPMVKAASRTSASDPSLDGSLLFTGPQRLHAPASPRLTIGRSDAHRMLTAWARCLADVSTPATTYTALGVIVVDTDGASVTSRLKALRTSKDLRALPVVVRGVSLSPMTSATPEVTDIDESSGPVRLDTVIADVGKQILAEAQATPEFMMPSELVGDVLGVTMARLSAPVIFDPPTHAEPDNTDQRSTMPERPEVSEPETAPDDLPLRLTYIVTALGAEARPRWTRARITDLVLQLDGALVPQDDPITSRTSFVVAGRPDIARKAVSTGKLERGDICRPSADDLDMTKTMDQVSHLLADDIAACNRRGHKLARPLVIFIMPSATIAGIYCHEYYKKIKKAADIGWLVTNPDAGAPSTAIDASRVVVDKPDAASELLCAMGLSPILAPDVS